MAALPDRPIFQKVKMSKNLIDRQEAITDADNAANLDEY